MGLRKEHTAAVVEIGMRGLHQIEAMAPIAAPTVGIVTNVGETHMELLGSIENIAKAKSEMVEAIPAAARSSSMRTTRTSRPCARRRRRASAS